MDDNGFIRSEVFGNNCEGIEKYCHIPLKVSDKTTNLNILFKNLKSRTVVDSDAPI